MGKLQVKSPIHRLMGTHCLADSFFIAQKVSRLTEAIYCDLFYFVKFKFHPCKYQIIMNEI